MNHPLELTVNGVRRQLLVRPGRTLLELLRDDLKLFGVRETCSMGVCGACTVLVDGTLVSSCIMLALQAKGKEVLTIEGLAKGGVLHPVQEAFIQEGGSQCGWCTPGMVLTAVQLLEENPRPRAEEIKAYMSGNLCRCTGYVKIIKAIQAAAHRMAAKA